MKYNARRLTGSCFALLAVALLSFAGCGSGSTGKVTGKVTVDGQPMAGLEVNFEPNDSSLGTTGTGYTQADGTYTLYYPGSETGIPAGEYTVRIVAAETDEPRPPVRIPAKFNSQSELVRTIEDGSNTFDFELTSN